MILSKKKFDPKTGLFAHKLGQNGVHRGIERVNFGFLRVPDPLGVEIMQKKISEKKLAFFGPKGLRKISGLPPPPKYRPQLNRDGRNAVRP